MNISLHDLTRTIIEQQRVIRELREQLVASEQHVKAFEDYATLQARVEKLEAALRCIVDEYESPSGCVIDGATMGRIAKEALED